MVYCRPGGYLFLRMVCVVAMVILLRSMKIPYKCRLVITSTCVQQHERRNTDEDKHQGLTSD